ncbi:HNH endonuclease [Campylobacterota bacterium DY0563]
MVLDITFIILGCLIIVSLIPLYIYRKEIYRKLSRKGDIKTFFDDTKNYLISNYPKIQFNFDILKKFENEEDIKVKETLIAEEFAKQFTYFEYELSTQKGVAHEKLWSSYDQNSKLLKDNKFPTDWAQRKKTAWMRDDGRCNRCGLKIDLSNTNALLVKQMKDGGGFNLENIVVLCHDCTKIIKSSNLEKTRTDLNLLDKLIKKIHL